MNQLDLIPSIVSEFIDEDILPELANGKRSAREIGQIIVERAHRWLASETGERELVSDTQCLTYCWVIASRLHYVFLIAYVERAFDEWGD